MPRKKGRTTRWVQQSEEIKAEADLDEAEADLDVSQSLHAAGMNECSFRCPSASFANCLFVFWPTCYRAVPIFHMASSKCLTRFRSARPPPLAQLYDELETAGVSLRTASIGLMLRPSDLVAADTAGAGGPPEKPRLSDAAALNRWPSIGPAAKDGGGQQGRAPLHGPDAQGDHGSEGEEEAADEDDSAGADGRSEPAAGRRKGASRLLNNVGSQSSRRRASIVETSDLRDRLKARAESTISRSGGLKVADVGDVDGGKEGLAGDDGGGAEGVKRRRRAGGENDEEAEDIDDDAMNSNLSDYKRGKRLKKLVKLLGSAQVCVTRGGHSQRDSCAFLARRAPSSPLCRPYLPINCN